MMTLSDGAKRGLEDYLRQIRAYLRSSRSVDADEIEQNVTEHIETELEGLPKPVSRDDLNAVLKKLGSPQQWVPAEELPWWRLVILRLRTGPEDWRLAYMSFGFLVAGVTLGSIHGILHRGYYDLTLRGIVREFLEGMIINRDIFLILALVLILSGFLCARALITLCLDPKEYRAKRWLLYPPLSVAYFVMVFILISLTGLLLGELLGIAFEWRYSDYWRELLIVSTGLWLFVLGSLSLRWPNLVSTIFRPFADKFKQKWAGLLLIIAISLIIVGTA